MAGAPQEGKRDWNPSSRAGSRCFRSRGGSDGGLHQAGWFSLLPFPSADGVSPLNTVCGAQVCRKGSEQHHVSDMPCVQSWWI